MTEREIFTAALAKEDPAERAAFLDRVCGDDGSLRRRIESLLADHQQLGSFMDVRSRAEKTLGASRSPAERTGTQIGPYKLLQQIGEGGMGVVYMAEQTAPVQRRVAIKIIKPGMDSRQVIARFDAEKQALALMDHANIARVLDAGTTEQGRPYFVMELVHGVPITKYCDDNRLTPRQRLELFVPVCQAIQHAHQKGIIHRDIKPSNVMVTLYDGKPVPKVIDFGVAKATEQRLTEQTLFTQYGTMVGTLEYMSPEQAEMSALGVDTRSDIYSLGVLLYELLTGSTPLTRQQMKEAAYGEILRLIKEEEPPRPSTRLSESGDSLASISALRHTEPAKLSKLLRGELDWIVMKTLEKDRNRRYETAASLASDVQRYLGNEAVLACPPSSWYRFRKFARRNTAALATACVVGLAVLLAVATLATSTVMIASALGAEKSAKEDLRRDSYFHRIALAHRELSVNNLHGALELLNACPEDLRDWEWHYLVRLCRVDPLVIALKTGVNGIAFSSDGERLASARSDGLVTIVSSRTGAVSQSLEAHAGSVSCVAFHPDGEHVASVGVDGQAKSVKVWNLTTGEMVFTAPCDSVHAFGTAYAAAFNPHDGRQLAVGDGGDVKIWDWRNDQLLQTFHGDEKHRLSVAFSRDGRRLATGSWGGSMKLWDAHDKSDKSEPIRTFPETSHHPVVALAFNKEGDRLATANFGRRVEIWDTTTGGLIHTLPHSGTVLGVAFSSDGRRLASTGEDKTVRIWDTASGREVLVLRGHKGLCDCVAFSPDGQRLASASVDGTIRIWNATPLEPHEGQQSLIDKQHRDEVWSVAVSPDGREVVSAGWSMPAAVWRVRTGLGNVEFSGHREIVFCVAWQPDGKRVASAGGNGDLFSVKVWDPRTGKEDFTLPALRGEPEFFAVAFSPKGKYLVTGRASGVVQVWDARTGQPVGNLGTHQRMIRGVVFSPDGEHLASISGDGKVKLWDGTRLEEKQEARLTLDAFSSSQCLNIAFSPDGKRLAIGGDGSTVKICDVATGEELHTLRGHTADVCSVAFSLDPDGRWLASAGEDSTVKIWDSHAGGAAVRTIRGHMALVDSVAFTPDGRLVSGSRDRTAKVWDLTALNDLPDSPGR